MSKCHIFVPLVTEKYGKTEWTNREVCGWRLALALLLRMHKNRRKFDNSRRLPCAFVVCGDVVCFQRRPVRHIANYVPLLIRANARLSASLYRSLCNVMYCIYSAFFMFQLKLADILKKLILPVSFLDDWPPDSLAIQFATKHFIEGRPTRDIANNNNIHRGHSGDWPHILHSLTMAEFSYIKFGCLGLRVGVKVLGKCNPYPYHNFNPSPNIS